MQPQQLVAGTTLTFVTSVAGYLASAGWTLRYYLVRRSGTGSITIAATAQGDDYLVSVTAATTAGWTPDTYSWESRVEKGAEKYTVDRGEIAVLPDITAKTGTFDNRTDTEIAYANVDAMLRGTASAATKRYRIGDRELEKFAVPDLITLHSKLAAALRRERRAAALEAGQADPRKTYVRFDRA